ncbi:MAG: hypothetical protein LBB77_09225, partial [Treponema sp.]|nr:hypothetical protein [Treponema sp.]
QEESVYEKKGSAITEAGSGDPGQPEYIAEDLPETEAEFKENEDSEDQDNQDQDDQAQGELFDKEE